MVHKATILLVEEDSFLAEIYTRHFSFHKYQTKIVKNFVEADRKIKTVIPDVIIVDIALVEQTGLLWLKFLKANEITKNIPIIVLTGIGDRENIKQALICGANKYFLKSQIKPHELAEQITSLLV